MTEERATSFGAAADSYESARPQYPVDAVRWLLEPVAQSPIRVADVGAGTGKLTRALGEMTDRQVVAVDPDSEMLETLKQVLPTVATHVGTAESLPLPDDSLDAVVLGQAWHWVEPGAASAEIGRVVRRGGVLGLVWNIRDEQTDWVRRLTEIMHGSDAEALIASGGPVVAEPFGSLDSQCWTWSRPISREGLQQLALSRSYVINADQAERARIRVEIDQLCAELGIVANATIDLPYLTHGFRTIRV